MAHIFVSHASEDNALTIEIMTWLRANGFDDTFLDIDKDTGIQPGSNWERTLYQNIDCSHAVILILTSHWLESKWCFAEFTQARALGKAIFPVIVGPGGERFVARDIQRLDLRQDREGGLARLGRELTRLTLEAQGGFAWDPHRPPYPGLLAFQAEDAAVYFGRDDDVRRLIERLSARRVQGTPNLVTLLGPSGSGKSSLLRAGVLPRLQRDRRNWIVLPPFRPRLDPVGDLAHAAAEALGQPDAWRSWHDRLSSEGGEALAQLAEALQTAAGAREAHVLVSIDQAEQLFTIAAPEERRTFLRLFDSAPAGRSMVIGLATLRSDYLGLWQTAAEGVARFEEFSLGPMPLSRIRQVIEGPARIAGLRIDEGLIAAATTDAGTEDALPLLAFTLRELYDRYAGERADAVAVRELSLAHYAALGDPAAGLNPLENSVRKRADEVLAELDPSAEDQQALREAFVAGLVWIDNKGEYARRQAVLDDLPERALPILERLEAARLLIFGEEAGKRTVEVAHESLLRKWPKLRGWLDEEREFLIGRSRLDQALREWQAASEADKPAALLQGLLLGRANQWLGDHPRALTAEQKAFIIASEAEAAAARRRSRRLRQMLAGGAAAFVLVAFVAAGLIWVAQQNVAFAEREREAAERGADATLLAFKSRELLQAGDVRQAAAAAIEAVRMLPTSETRSALLEAVLALSPHLARSVEAGDMRPSVAAFVPGSDQLLVAGSTGELRSWRPTASAPPAPFATLPRLEGAGPQPPVVQAFLATEVGGGVAVLRDGRLVRLDAAGNVAATVMLAPDVAQAAIADDGTHIIAASSSARTVSAYLCSRDAGAPACEATPLASGFATALAIDRQGKTAALAMEGEGLVRVDLSAQPPVATNLPLDGETKIRSLAFDSGGRLAAGSVDGRIFIVDGDTAAAELPRQAGAVTALAFDPSSGRLASSCGRGEEICIWRPGSGSGAAELQQRLTGHANIVRSIAWAPGTGALASVSSDGSVKHWRVDGPDPTAFALRTPTPTALSDLDLSADGRWLAAGAEDGSVVVWDLAAHALAGTLPGERRSQVRSLRWRPGLPLQLAAVDESGIATVWSWPESVALDKTRIADGLVEAIRWLPDRSSIIAGTLGGKIRLWPLGGNTIDFHGMHPESVVGLAVLPEGDRLLSTDTLGNLWLWDVASRERIGLDWEPAGTSVDEVALDHARTRVVTAGLGGALHVYELDKPGAPTRIDLGVEQITGARWSDDDALIAAIDAKGTLVLWSMAENRMLASAQVARLGGEQSTTGQLRQLLWVPGGSVVAIATTGGKVLAVNTDPNAWLARAAAVFGFSPREGSTD